MSNRIEKIRYKQKRRHIFKNIIIPGILTGISVVLIFFALKYFDEDLFYVLGSGYVIFTSFASSAFILFMMPRSKAAKSNKFLKSYIIAGVFGYMGFLISTFIGLYLATAFILILVAILLALTRSEHPPALGITFAFIVYNVGFKGIAIVISMAIMLMVLRYILDRFVFDLEDLEVITYKKLRNYFKG